MRKEIDAILESGWRLGIVTWEKSDCVYTGIGAQKIGTKDKSSFVPIAYVFTYDGEIDWDGKDEIDFNMSDYDLSKDERKAIEKFLASKNKENFKGIRIDGAK
jgi:hypothetical protein